MYPINIVLVGAGRLATQLGLALQQTSSHRVCQVYSRTTATAAHLASVLGCTYTTDIQALRGDADLYIVAVTDGALPTLLPAIVADKQPEALFVHTAGSVPMSLWQGYTPHYGVLYPLQTFSKERAACFQEIPILVEAATPEDGARLLQLAQSLSGHVAVVSSEQRQALHLAAVIANNFANHMYAISHHLLAEKGIPFSVLHPLLKETTEKVLSGVSPTVAQTGPAVRYDQCIIEKHLAQLANHPLWQQIYELISKSIHHDQL